MAIKKIEPETPETDDKKFIKVAPEDHFQIKVQAARKGKTMGDYIAELSRKDAEPS